MLFVVVLECAARARPLSVRRARPGRWCRAARPGPCRRTSDHGPLAVSVDVEAVASRREVLAADAAAAAAVVKVVTWFSPARQHAVLGQLAPGAQSMVRPLSAGAAVVDGHAPAARSWPWPCAAGARGAPLALLGGLARRRSSRPWSPQVSVMAEAPSSRAPGRSVNRSPRRASAGADFRATRATSLALILS